MSGVGEIVFGAPVASVDVEQNWVGRLHARQAHFDELVEIGSVGDALVWRRLGMSEDVFGGHSSKERWLGKHCDRDRVISLHAETGQAPSLPIGISRARFGLAFQFQRLAFFCFLR